MKRLFNMARSLFSWKMTKQLVEKRYMIFSVIYCAQGLVFGLTSLVFAVYLQKEFGLNMTQVTSMLAIAYIPWFIKPLWGIISDRVPIYGRKRIPWIVICSFVVFLGCLALGTVVNSAWSFVAAAFFLNAGFGFVDVACDALAAEKCKVNPREEGTIQAICWEARCLGVIFVCTFGGNLAAWLGYRFIFNLMAIFPLILLFICWSLMKEEGLISGYIRKDRGGVWKRLWHVLCLLNPINLIKLIIWVSRLLIKLFKVIFWVFGKIARFIGTFEISDLEKIFNLLIGLLRKTPLFITNIASIIFKKIIELKLLFVAGFFLFILGMAPVFSPEASNCFLSNILKYTDGMRSWAFVVGGIGGFLGLRYCRCFISNPETGVEVDIQKIFKVTIILGAILGIQSVWNVYYYPTMLLFSIIGAPISYIMLVTSMRVAVRACPPGVEGTVFAIMMSLCNLGGRTGGIIGSKIFDHFGGFTGVVDGMPVYADPHRGWVYMVVLASIGSLVPLILIPMLTSFKQGGKAK